MNLGIYLNNESLNHNVPNGHPERNQRYLVLKDLIENKYNKNIVNFNFKEKVYEILELNHSKEYINNLQNSIPEKGINKIDDDTFISSKSLVSAYMGVCAGIRAVDDIFEGKNKRAFICSRPPGHHAEPNRPMGFCLFSNAAIISKYSIKEYNLSRVVVLDYDIHHGNGTQESFKSDENLKFFSTHEMPLFPGTGYENEKGLGNIFNYPLNPNCESSEFTNVWINKILPKVKEINPDLIILSSGFDAHIDDNISTAKINSVDYKLLTKEIVDVANNVCNGKVLSFLEGGYNLNALKESVHYHLHELNQ